MLRSLSLLLLVSTIAFAASSEEKEDGIKNGTTHWRHHHRGGRHGHHGHRHQPEFLKDVSKDQKKEYFKIVFDRNATRATIKKNVAEWAKKAGVEKQLADYNDKRELFFTEHNKNVTEAIPKLAAAQTAILAILKDDSLTHKQSWEKIHALTKDYSPQLRSLVYALKPHHRGHRGGRGGEDKKKGGKKEEKEEEKKSDEKTEEKSDEDEKKSDEDEKKSFLPVPNHGFDCEISPFNTLSGQSSQLDDMLNK